MTALNRIHLQLWRGVANTIETVPIAFRVTKIVDHPYYLESRLSYNLLGLVMSDVIREFWGGCSQIMTRAQSANVGHVIRVWNWLYVS